MPLRARTGVGSAQRGARGDPQAAQGELRAAPGERDSEVCFGVLREVMMPGPAPAIDENGRGFLGPRRRQSYLRCWQGVVFFAFVIDAYSRMIVGWQLATNMRTSLVLDAPNTPASTTPRASTITASSRPSDRSAMPMTRRKLPRQLQNRTRRRPCLANTNATRAQYIAWFNHHRLHESLGDTPPGEHEVRYPAANRKVPDATHPGKTGNPATGALPGGVDRLGRQFL